MVFITNSPFLFIKFVCLMAITHTHLHTYVASKNLGYDVAIDDDDDDDDNLNTLDNFYFLPTIII